MISHILHKKKVRQFHEKKLQKGFLNSFLFSKLVHRKFPVQAAFHIVLDGALIGVLTTATIMSVVALHSQYLWTSSFTKLDMSRDLNRRILESTSIIESYFLKNQKFSRSLVPTEAKDLMYVDRPRPQNLRSLDNETSERRLLKKIASFPLKAGY